MVCVCSLLGCVISSIDSGHTHVRLLTTGVILGDDHARIRPLCSHCNLCWDGRLRAQINDQECGRTTPCGS